MTVVINATPLIALAILGRLDLLRRLFKKVIVPTAVYEEVVLRGSGRVGAQLVSDADWLDIQTPTTATTIEPLLLGLDEGEMQVLLLAREVIPDWVLLDEKLGRRVAKALGLPVKGTLGVLLTAVLAELMTKEQGLEALETLLAHNIRIAPRWQTWFKEELRDLSD
jgi:uncharacterized protein